MEIVTELINNQFTLCIPVVLVIAVVILVFTFGFKSAEQPPFDKLTIDERKQAGKKRKSKEKKTILNGHIITGEIKNEKSPIKEIKKSPNKEIAESPKLKKQSPIIKKDELKQIKNDKKSLKKLINEKPIDYDEGNWETVTSKSDKKKKQEQSPIKKDNQKKIKKIEIIQQTTPPTTPPPPKQTKNKTTTTTTTTTTTVVKETVNQKKDKEINNKKIHELSINEQPKKDEKKKEKKSKDINKKKIIDELVKPKENVIPSSSLTTESGSNVAFDEIGDVWTEAKTAKKSKKKARRDN